MRKITFTTAVAALALAGCGTFQLAGAVYPTSEKSAQQQQLDVLTCKDQAKLAANTAERQAGAFALGLTIVGAPVAYEMEKTKQREVFKLCMEGRGYRVVGVDENPEAKRAADLLPPVR